ncbi:MAG: hypothetical protein ACQGVK_16835 [Myxococcota bacterium]
MSGRAQAARAPTAWLRPLFEAPGCPVWVVGVAVAGLGSLAFGLQELALGRYPVAAADPNVLYDMRVAVTHVVITAYLLTAYVYAQRTTEQSIAALRPLLESDRLDAPLAISRGERVALWLSAPIAIAIFVLVNTRVSPGEVSLAPTTWDPEVSWHRVLGFAMAILTIRLSTLIVLESRRLSDLSAALRRVDLLSPEALAPFARQGLTFALLVIGSVSAFALFLVDLRYLPLVGLVLVGTLPIAAVALLLPLRGIREKIIEAKHQELEWCRERIRERRARLASGAVGDSTRLDELLAWEARIQEVREWPIDASTFKRFGLYLLLPLGSWAGGALVERGIDRILD